MKEGEHQPAQCQLSAVDSSAATVKDGEHQPAQHQPSTVDSSEASSSSQILSRAEFFQKLDDIWSKHYGRPFFDIK